MDDTGTACAQRLALARKARGLSLRALADRAGVSAMALSKIERGVFRPSRGTRERLNGALDLDDGWLTRQPLSPLTDVAYRTLRDLPLSEQRKSRIFADVMQQLELRLDCEAVLPQLAPGPHGLPPMLARVSTLDQVETIAEQVRFQWDLHAHPIRNLMVTVEQHGYRVFVTAADAGERFDGFSAQCEAGPVIVLGSGWTGDRQRFTLAHELGHHVLSGRLTDDLDEETACHRFAAALLVPRSAVIDRLGPSRSRITPYELFALKHEWGLSMQAWVRRAHHLGVLNDAVFPEHLGVFRRNGWFREEPLAPVPVEQPFRMQVAVAAALADDRLDRGVASALLAIDDDLLDDLLMMGGR